MRLMRLGIASLHFRLVEMLKNQTGQFQMELTPNAEHIITITGSQIAFTDR